MSNRPVKKKKVVEITQEDFDVEWTPPPRTGRDRIIQIGVLILIVLFALPFLLPALTGFSGPSDAEIERRQQQQQVSQLSELDLQIKQYSEQLAKDPKDGPTLANLGYYMTQKAANMPAIDGDDTERMTMLATSEKYLRDALEQDPDYAFAQQELAKNLMIQGKNDEAGELINKGLAAADEDLKSEDEKVVNAAKARKMELLRLSAVSDAEAKNFESALEKMTQVVELNPGEANSYIVRSRLHQEMGNKDLARKDLELVVDMGQKMGNQQLAAFGQQMIEELDNPKLEIVKIEQTEVTPTPSP